MSAKLKVDQLETVDGTGNITVNNQLTGLTSASIPTLSSSHMPTGSVLDVVFNTNSTNVQVTSTSWLYTGLTVTLTPKSVSSKILVEWQQHTYFATSTNVWEGFKARLLRNGTVVWTDAYAIAHAKYQGATMDKRGDSWLDSPNTTSSVVYTVEVLPYSTATHSFNHGGATSQIKAIEIAG